MSKRVYQMYAPVYLAAVILALWIVKYFTSYGAAQVTIFMAWSSVIASIFAIYGYTFSLLMHSRRISRWKEQQFGLGLRSIGTIIVFAVFFLYAFTLKEGVYDATYQLIYYNTVPVALFGVNCAQRGMNIFSVFGMFKRKIGILSAVFFSIWIICTLRQSSMLIYLVPALATFGDWIMLSPNIGPNRACMFVWGIGVVFMGLRALIGKEPGVVETEAM